MSIENPLNSTRQIPNDPWEILGISRDATVENIEKAWREKALIYHPDRNHEVGAEEWIRAINNARDFLLTDSVYKQTHSFSDFSNKEKEYWDDFSSKEKKYWDDFK